jgi:hypothetical protein
MAKKQENVAKGANVANDARIQEEARAAYGRFIQAIRAAISVDIARVLAMTGARQKWRVAAETVGKRLWACPEFVKSAAVYGYRSAADVVPTVWLQMVARAAAEPERYITGNELRVVMIASTGAKSFQWLGLRDRLPKHVTARSSATVYAPDADTLAGFDDIPMPDMPEMPTQTQEADDDDALPADTNG